VHSAVIILPEELKDNEPTLQPSLFRGLRSKVCEWSLFVGASYRTQAHHRRYSENEPVRPTLELLWILRTPSHAPNRIHGSWAGRALWDDGLAGFAG
jgi:hypothetical protein